MTALVPIPDGFMLPVITPFNRAWFTSGTLAIQQCADCAELQHPPEEVCRACGAMAFTTRVVAPSGTIHSHTVVHHGVHRSLEATLPYAIVLVSLDDNPLVRVVGNLIDADTSDVVVGRSVVAVWTDHTTDDGTIVRLPQWRLAAPTP